MLSAVAVTGPSADGLPEPIGKSGSFIASVSDAAENISSELSKREQDLKDLASRTSANIAARSNFTPVRFNYKSAPARQPRIGVNLPIGRCINLSNVLEAPKEGEWGKPVEDGDFAFIADAGFKTVRIPINWAAHAKGAAPYSIDKAFMARVHHVVQAATDNHLNVIINVHHFSSMMTDPDAHYDRLAGIWAQISLEFSDAPTSVWFEILNEPQKKLNNKNIIFYLKPSLENIRKNNPNRPVIIGGEDWSSLNSLSDLNIPSDPYLVPTFHYYTPFDFTHQGAHWVKSAPPFGRRWGSREDKEILDRDVARAEAYMDRTGRAPFIGEFGAQDDAKVPIADRIRYYGAVSGAFASAGIQSCAWGYASGFRLRDNTGWLPGIQESIRTTR